MSYLGAGLLVGAATAVTKKLRNKEKKEEIGDLFFSVINLTRLLNFDPEICIYEANKKFAKRCEIYFSLKDKKNDPLSKEEDYKLWQLTKKFESEE